MAFLVRFLISQRSSGSDMGFDPLTSLNWFLVGPKF